MSRIFVGLCSLFLIVVFTPTPTRADPIVVTSGTITVSGLAGGPHFNLSGNNFTATSLGGDTGNFQLQSACAPCVAGQTLGVGGSFIGAQIGGRRPSNSRKFLNLLQYCCWEAALLYLRQSSDVGFPPGKIVLREAFFVDEHGLPFRVHPRIKRL